MINNCKKKYTKPKSVNDHLIQSVNNHLTQKCQRSSDTWQLGIRNCLRRTCYAMEMLEQAQHFSFGLNAGLGMRNEELGIKRKNRDLIFIFIR